MGAALALVGGLIYTSGGSVPLALVTGALALLPAGWIMLVPSSLGDRLARRAPA